jgi:ferredoxin
MTQKKMSKIHIDQQKCTKCSACTASCPVLIITTDSEGFPELNNENGERCIQCYHCEAVCPSQALTHELSEKAYESALEPQPALSSGMLGCYMQRRRSIRQYKQQKIEKEKLEQALEVVRYAPTGTNRQFNEWIIVSDDKLIHQLAEGTIDWMRAVVKMNPEMAARYNFPALIKAWEGGIDLICRSAPHLAFCLTPTNHPIGLKDATIAAAHLELYLPSMGAGGCWAGYLMIAIQQSQPMKQLIGITDDSTVHAALLMGYPKYKYVKAPARNKANVKWL